MRNFCALCRSYFRRKRARSPILGCRGRFRGSLLTGQTIVTSEAVSDANEEYVNRSTGLGSRRGNAKALGKRLFHGPAGAIDGACGEGEKDGNDTNEPVFSEHLI